MSPAEITYHRRVRLLELADELGNESAACRQMGTSLTRYYELRAVVARYGLAALMPKEQPLRPHRGVGERTGGRNRDGVRSS